MSQDYTIRVARPEDYDRIEPVLDEWFGRHMTGLPRFFLDHFFNTSFVAEAGDELLGFFVGFLSPARPTVAYGHYIGVRPDFRRTGLGRELAERFLAMVKENGRTEVWGAARSSNELAMKFYQHMGAAFGEEENGIVDLSKEL